MLLLRCQSCGHEQIYLGKGNVNSVIYEEKPRLQHVTYCDNCGDEIFISSGTRKSLRLAEAR